MSKCSSWLASVAAARIYGHAGFSSVRIGLLVGWKGSAVSNFRAERSLGSGSSRRRIVEEGGRRLVVYSQSARLLSI